MFDGVHPAGGAAVEPQPLQRQHRRHRRPQPAERRLMSLKSLDAYCQVLNLCAIKTATLLELRQTIPQPCIPHPKAFVNGGAGASGESCTCHLIRSSFESYKYSPQGLINGGAGVGEAPDVLMRQTGAVAALPCKTRPPRRAAGLPPRDSATARRSQTAAQ